MTSSVAVSGFIATRKSISFLRPMYPCLFARIVYQVGKPAILEGNMFLPETGTPIWKIARRRTVFELCDPEPFTVATWMLMSLTMRCLPMPPLDSRGTTSVVAIPTPSFIFKGGRTRPVSWIAEEETLLLYGGVSRASRHTPRLEPGG